MANIMINKACNLNCSYCFANEFVNKDEYNMSMENLERAIRFACHNQNNVSIGVIGGEPLLHPNFEQILSRLIHEPRIASILVFTNGLLLNKYFKILSHKKVKLLVNLNDPQNMSHKKYQQIISNLDKLHFEYYKGDDVTLGINMYKPDFNYQYLLNELKKYRKTYVRTCIAVPNTPEKKGFSALDYFRSMKPGVIEFFKKAKAIGVMPSFDCNLLPTCTTTDEEKAFLTSLWDMEKTSGNFCSAGEPSNCSPVIDILPDLQAVRCFGTSDQDKVHIDQFKDVNELINYYKFNYDSFAYHVHNEPECMECDQAKKMVCMGGCLAFKNKKINAVKKSIGNINQSVS